MSLPDPTAFVTEERLNEYHNIILPFLGGMPDILANKFARGDMYSTDEKMIGQWIDGKPIYQKVLKSKALTIAHWTWQNICEDADFCNAVEKMVDCRFYTSDAFQYDGIYRINAGAIQMYTYGNDDTIPANKDIIIQYTKTTDSPIEIGNDTDYSTEEKIIGTWIDGKPIYQKTISVAIPLNTQSGGCFYAAFEPLISNIIPIKCNVLGYQGSSKGYTCSDVVLRIDASNGRWFLYCINDITMVTSITLQYTKTTD